MGDSTLQEQWSSWKDLKVEELVELLDPLGEGSFSFVAIALASSCLTPSPTSKWIGATLVVSSLFSKTTCSSQSLIPILIIGQRPYISATTNRPPSCTLTSSLTPSSFLNRADWTPLAWVTLKSQCIQIQLLHESSMVILVRAPTSSWLKRQRSMATTML